MFPRKISNTSLFRSRAIAMDEKRDEDDNGCYFELDESKHPLSVDPAVSCPLIVSLN
jgi:hypothetical protein